MKEGGGESEEGGGESEGRRGGINLFLLPLTPAD